LHEGGDPPPAENVYAPRSPGLSAAFLAYEIVSAAAFTLLFTPYALFKMIGAPAYRVGIRQRLSLWSDRDKARAGANPVWIQAVSLGEVNSAEPLVRMVGGKGEIPVFLTSTTATGYDAAGRLQGPDGNYSYFPLDFSPIAQRVLSFVRPRVLVLFETEIWPNLIRAAHSRDIPVTIVNGRISEKSFRYYKMVPKIFNHVLSLIGYCGMQSEKDAERIVALGARPETIQVCGNVKFDSSPPPPSTRSVEEMRGELRLERDAPVIVAGSTHEGEESALLYVYRKILDGQGRARLVLAPRHPERFDGVEATIRAAGFGVWRKSRASEQADPGPETVILLDTMGELAKVYALASVSFVGGSLAKVGGHNIIEPASVGKPLVFGPHMHHFEDVKDAFIRENAAVCVEDEGQLLRTISGWLENPQKARAVGEAAKRVVESHRGATEKYYQALKEYF